MSTDLDTAIAEADFETATEDICLRGSLNAKWEQAEVAAARAHDEYNTAIERGEATAPYAARRTEALAAFEAVDAELKAASIQFTLSGVEEAVWKATQLRHPPREGQQLDTYLGYNRDAARADLIRVALIDPVPDDQQWARLLKKMNAGQLERLYRAARKLNEEQDGQVPFSFAVSEVMRALGETSSAPEPSASAPDASGDGGPETPTTSSGTSSPAT
jgi:hypothetical protein